MNRLVKYIAGVLLVVILVLVYTWFFVYNKPHTDYEKAVPDFSIEAGILFHQYVNHDTASEKYTGKVLVISGIPTLIEENDSTTILVYVFSRGMFGDEGIRCTMLPSFREQAIKSVASTIQLKGFCSGYNDTDIIFEHCSILNQ